MGHRNVYCEECRWHKVITYEHGSTDYLCRNPKISKLIYTDGTSRERPRLFRKRIWAPSYNNENDCSGWTKKLFLQSIWFWIGLSIVSMLTAYSFGAGCALHYFITGISFIICAAIVRPIILWTIPNMLDNSMADDQQIIGKDEYELITEAEEEVENLLSEGK